MHAATENFIQLHEYIFVCLIRVFADCTDHQSHHTTMQRRNRLPSATQTIQITLVIKCSLSGREIIRLRSTLDQCLCFRQRATAKQCNRLLADELKLCDFQHASHAFKFIDANIADTQSQVEVVAREIRKRMKRNSNLRKM